MQKTLTTETLTLVSEVMKLSVMLNTISQTQIELSYNNGIMKITYNNGDGFYIGEIDFSSTEALKNLYELVQEFRGLWTATYYEFTYHFSPNKYKKLNEQDNLLPKAV